MDGDHADRVETAVRGPLLVHHAANRGHRFPPSSLSALRVCLEAGAQAIEVDVTPLLDDYALFHDERWEDATDGHGLVSGSDAKAAQSLHFVGQYAGSQETVGLLSQAVEMLQSYPHVCELQLDLKSYARLDEVALGRLLAIISPVKNSVVVSSGTDWALRTLRRLDGSLRLGFDPLLYLDMAGDQDRGAPPFQRGAYGYLDDHPLAVRRWGTSAEYLAARAEALVAQAPQASVWYIRGELLKRGLVEGYDWPGYVHSLGAEVDAWTLDPDNKAALSLARQLLPRVDRITTNNAPRLARELGGLCRF